MSIQTVTEKEAQLAHMLKQCTEALTLATAERDAAQQLAADRLAQMYEDRKQFLDLKALVAKVHTAKGRYHSQIAMAALYEACGLPNVKPTSGEKS